MTEQDRLLAETIRAACVTAARDAYDDAGLRGLCPEGRWEVALDAIRSLDVEAIADSEAIRPPRRQ
jgi:hypothetical protein